MGKFVFLALFVTLLGAGLLFWSLRGRKQSGGQVAAARHWPEATAVVDSAEVRTNNLWGLRILSGRYMAMHEPILNYRFQVAGQTYHGNRLSFGYVRTSYAHQARKLLAPYLPGSWIKIRYNPHDPRDNVVEVRETSNQKWGVIVGGLLTAFGLVMLIMTATGVIKDDGRPSSGGSYRSTR